VGRAAALVGGVGQIPPEGVDRVTLLPLERTVQPNAIWLVRHIAMGRQRRPVDPNMIPSDVSPTTINRLMPIPPPLRGRICTW
jgi:hypothetical protein